MALRRRVGALGGPRRCQAPLAPPTAAAAAADSRWRAEAPHGPPVATRRTRPCWQARCGVRRATPRATPLSVGSGDPGASARSLVARIPRGPRRRQSSPPLSSTTLPVGFRLTRARRWTAFRNSSGFTADPQATALAVEMAAAALAAGSSRRTVLAWCRPVGPREGPRAGRSSAEPAARSLRGRLARAAHAPPATTTRALARLWLEAAAQAPAVSSGAAQTAGRTRGTAPPVDT